MAQGQVAKAIEEIPGAQALKLAPSMRGDKRVAVRFNLVARKASDEAAHEDYTKKFEASDNLKYALSSDHRRRNQKPLGEAAVPTPAASAFGKRRSPAASSAAGWRACGASSSSTRSRI